MSISSSVPPLIASSLGDWDSPSVELRRVFLDVKHPNSPIIIEGNVEVDTRFFRRVLHSHPSPFAVTVALTIAGSLRPLDWNQEDSKESGLQHSRANPLSNITLHRRIEVDGNFCSIPFVISIPQDIVTSAAAANRDSAARSQQYYGVAVKAYDGAGRVTQTNIATFALQLPASRINRSLSLLEPRRKSRELQASREFVTTVKQRRKSFLRRGCSLRGWK